MTNYPYRQLGVSLDRKYREDLNKNFVDIEEDIRGVHDEISGVHDEINKNREQIDHLGNRVNGLDNRQDNLENRWDTVVNEVTTDTEVIESRVDIFGNRFPTLNRRISETDKIAYSAYSISHSTVEEVRTLRIRNFGDTVRGAVVGIVPYYVDNRGLVIADVGVNDNSYPFNFKKVGAVN